MSIFIVFSIEEQQNIQLIVSFLLISELLYKEFILSTNSMKRIKP
jgi:hypothetical protein